MGNLYVNLWEIYLTIKHFRWKQIENQNGVYLSILGNDSVI